jgi:hypothetical protein
LPEVQLRLRVAAVIEPDSRIGGALCLLLKIEFGISCQLAHDFQTVLRTLSPDRLLFIVARLERERAFSGPLGVPIIPLSAGPIDTERLINEIRAATDLIQQG